MAGTIKFFDEMQKASNVSGQDRMMIGKAESGETQVITFDQAKQFLDITSNEIAPIVGGDSEANATEVPAGPAGQTRRADVAPGWIDFGDGPIEAPATNRWMAYWDGSTWSLVDMGELPDKSRQAATYFNESGYISKGFGEKIEDEFYKSSFYMTLTNRGNLRITGFSGVENNVALASFYDKEFKYLGYYNADEHGFVDDHQVPESSIPELTFYIRGTRHTSQAAQQIAGVKLDLSNVPSVPMDSAKNYLWSGYGHIRKDNGQVDRSSLTTYRYSKFLRIIDRGFLLLTVAYSGASSSVAMIAFYDADFRFLSALNTTDTGIVTDYMVNPSDIPDDAVFIRVTRSALSIGFILGVEITESFGVDEVDRFIERTLEGSVFENYESGYISKATGNVINSNDYIHTNAYIITDRSNLIVTGYSGVTNNVGLATFYNRSFEYVGTYNAPTHGFVSRHQIPESEIPSNAYYVRVSLNAGQSALIFVKGARKKQINLVEFERLISKTLSDFSVSAFSIPAIDLFSEIGYINKTSGDLDTSGPTYRSSTFLIIDDRLNLRVSGWSGVSNNAALAYFYDDQLRPIGYYNAPTNGTIYFHTIPEDQIPVNAVYVRFTRTEPQAIFFEGASNNYRPENMLRYVESVRRSMTETASISLSRGVRANVDKGGHIKMLNYLGNDQNIHPKVLYFDSPWNGYRYWMAYTPYPAGDVDAENPCIAASNDGMTWVTPSGMVNPLAYRLNESNYNSDTHLLYREDTDTLECWWREYKFEPTPAQDAIVRSISTDGINWGEKEYCFDYGDHDGNILSPAIVFEDGLYKLWKCGGGIMYAESPTGSVGSWTELENIPMDLTGITAWHLDVQVTPFGREFIIQGYIPGNGNNTSDLYHSITTDDITYTKPEIIIDRGDMPTDPDYQGIYRSCMLYINGIYHIWYTGIGRNLSTRTLNLSKGRRLNQLRGVNLP